MARDEQEEERRVSGGAQGPQRAAILPSGWRRSRRRASPTRTRPSTGCARRASPSPAPPGWSASTATAAGRSTWTSRPSPHLAAQAGAAGAGAAARARRSRPREAAGGGQGLPAALSAAGGRDPAARCPASTSSRSRPTSRSARRREFAAVTLHAAELRLGLDLGRSALRCNAAEDPSMKGPGPAISHMLVLTDARQVNAELLNLIKAANARVNG